MFFCYWRGNKISGGKKVESGLDVLFYISDLIMGMLWFKTEHLGHFLPFPPPELNETGYVLKLWLSTSKNIKKVIIIYGNKINRNTFFCYCRGNKISGEKKGRNL